MPKQDKYADFEAKSALDIIEESLGILEALSWHITRYKNGYPCMSAAWGTMIFRIYPHFDKSQKVNWCVLNSKTKRLFGKGACNSAEIAKRYIQARYFK